MPIVNGLAEQYDGRMEFEVVKTTDPGAEERIKQYGFDIHGMVITDAQDKILWKEEGHLMKGPAVQAQIDQLLGG